ncbi:hypothetical protein Slin15195_G023050 [Septoria linicola]|uniref:Uncharacterized protein n=1 Tax=Septoria linicola TaxID=215465 RepID=A0A9Q9AQJ7_9PEZI|nr:hypothetical protein Slin15195_G023050 [Septoria linicola]
MCLCTAEVYLKQDGLMGSRRWSATGGPHESHNPNLAYALRNVMNGQQLLPSYGTQWYTTGFLQPQHRKPCPQEVVDSMQ